MWLNSLRTIAFRNLIDSTHTFSPNTVLITGDNGAGKTNLLESIAVAVTGSSPRTRVIQHLVRNRENTKFTVATQWHTTNNVSISATAHSSSTKRIIQTTSPQTTIPLTFFSPSDLYLVKGSPANRRRFLDQLLFATDRTYLKAWRQYRTALIQRNALLKRHSPGHLSDDHLSSWEDRLSAAAGIVMNKRNSACLHLQTAFAVAHARIASLSEHDVQLVYSPCLHMPPSPGSSANSWAEAISSELAQRRANDLNAGYTSVGPHRDDVTITLKGSDARLFASQGQQRTLSLSLRVAQHTVLEEDAGEAGTLLLDDVASELDRHRRDRLLTSFSGRQIIITTTDAALFPEPDQLINIQQGAVISNEA